MGQAVLTITQSQILPALKGLVLKTDYRYYSENKVGNYIFLNSL